MKIITKGQQMVSANDLTSKYGESTVRFVLYSMGSAGVYTYVWLFERYKGFNKMIGKELISRNFLLTMILVYGASMIIEPSFSAHPSSVALLQMLDLLSGFVKFAAWIMLLICAFRVRTILRGYFLSHSHIDLSINPVLVVLFNIIYINYCLNNLEAKVEKAQAKKQVSQRDQED